MNELLHDLALIFGMAGLWALSGYLIGLVLVALGLDAYPFEIIIASINVILGLLWLKGFIPDAIEDRMVFEWPHPDEDRDMRINYLWWMPTIFIFIGIFVWFWTLIVSLWEKINGQRQK